MSERTSGRRIQAELAERLALGGASGLPLFPGKSNHLISRVHPTPPASSKSAVDSMSAFADAIASSVITTHYIKNRRIYAEAAAGSSIPSHPSGLCVYGPYTIAFGTVAGKDI